MVAWQLGLQRPAEGDETAPAVVLVNAGDNITIQYSSGFEAEMASWILCTRGCGVQLSS
jgi:hypothetical protein